MCLLQPSAPQRWAGRTRKVLATCRAGGGQAAFARAPQRRPPKEGRRARLARRPQQVEPPAAYSRLTVWALLSGDVPRQLKPLGQQAPFAASGLLGFAVTAVELLGCYAATCAVRVVEQRQQPCQRARLGSCPCPWSSSLMKSSPDFCRGCRCSRCLLYLCQGQMAERQDSCCLAWSLLTVTFSGTVSSQSVRLCDMHLVQVRISHAGSEHRDISCLRSGG